MSKRLNDESTYPFYWLDELAEITLNPDKNNVAGLTATELNTISERLPGEFSRICCLLKHQAFCLYCSDQLKVVAGHYDQSIRLLQKQAAANLTQYPRKGLLRQTGELLATGLADLANSLYNRYPSFVQPPAEAATETIPSGLLNKILCALSADQLGILLRAATDAGVLVGRSFRKICTAVAPFLSTPWKSDIKPDTLRSHATRPEIRDKEVAIAFLEKMIDKIRGYR